MSMPPTRISAVLSMCSHAGRKERTLRCRASELATTRMVGTARRVDGAARVEAWWVLSRTREQTPTRGTLLRCAHTWIMVTPPGRRATRPLPA